MMVLRNRKYMLVWTGTLLSSIGDWVLRAALPFYVYLRTDSPLATGAAFIAGALPYVLLPSVAGVFVDRWDRKKTLIVTNLARAGLMLLLLLAQHSKDVVLIVFCVNFVEACITQFASAASIAFLPRLVAKEHLQEANALKFLATNLPRVLGVLAGGALLANFGFASTVITDSISYLAPAFLLVFVVVPSTPMVAEGKIGSVEGKHAVTARWLSYWRGWLEGLNVVRQNPTIRSLFVVVGLAGLADGSIGALLVVFAQGVVHASPTQYSWMIISLGIGTIIGSLVCGLFTKFVPLLRFLAGCLVIEGLVYIAAFDVQSLPASLPLFLLAGIPAMGWQVSTQTALQQLVADQVRGRVFGSYIMTTSLLLLIGTGLGSVLASQVNILLVLNLGCVFFVLAGGGAFLWLRSFQPSQAETPLDVVSPASGKMGHFSTNSAEVHPESLPSSPVNN